MTRKGSTLAELCVVLAVIAIAATVVISFWAMVNSRVMLSRVKLTAADEVLLMEGLTENWISAMAERDAVFAVTSDKITATSPNGECYTLSFSEGELYGELPEGKKIVGAAERILSVRFDVMQRSDGSDQLFFCKIRYSAGADVLLQTVCINPRVGETIPMGGAA